MEQLTRKLKFFNQYLHYIEYLFFMKRKNHILITLDRLSSLLDGTEILLMEIATY